MPLNPIRPGLRVINKSNDVTKVNLLIPAGDELEVSEYVAAQLAGQTLDFVPKDDPAAEKALPYPPPEPEPAPLEDGEPVKAEKPAPAKRAAKKRPAKS